MRRKSNRRKKLIIIFLTNNFILFVFYFQFEDTAIAKRCLQIYFGLPRISNQFLARAYLCQFELNAPKATNQLVTRNKFLKN